MATTTKTKKKLPKTYVEIRMDAACELARLAKAEAEAKLMTMPEYLRYVLRERLVG